MGSSVSRCRVSPRIFTHIYEPSFRGASPYRCPVQGELIIFGQVRESMKIFTLKLATTILTGMLITANPTWAQSVAQTAGTFSGFGPDTILVRSTASGEPVRYFSSQTTMYVDEMGIPIVSIDSLKVGAPLTVEYIKIADQLVASRVVLRNSSPVEGKKAAIATSNQP